MKSVLVLYYSHGGHTARIARRIWETIIAEGHKADLMGIVEADREGVDWNKYDTVIIGCAVIYGKMNRELVAFVNRFKAVLDAKATSFFSVSLIARAEAKCTPEGNLYTRKFLENNPWKPKDAHCFAGKVDYPNWGWLDTKAIQMIMKMTKGPTEPTAIIDYTNWDDVPEYARHCLTLQALSTMRASAASVDFLQQTLPTSESRLKARVIPHTLVGF